MDFTRLEKQIITATYGEANAERIFAGALPLRAEPEPDPNIDPDDEAPGFFPNSISLTATLMVAAAVGTPEDLHPLRESGRITVVEAPNAAWVAPVTRVLHDTLSQFGRTMMHRRDTVLTDSSAIYARHLLLSRSDTDRADFGRSSKPDPYAELTSVMTAVANRRSILIVVSKSDVSLHSQVRALSAGTVTIAGPDADIVAKLIHVFCRKQSPFRMAHLPANIEPLTVAFAFGAEHTPERALELLSAGAPRPAKRPGHQYGLDDIVGMDPLKHWAEALARDVAAVRAGALNPWQLPRGVLVVGPSGVGKTRAADAIAQHADLPIVHGSVGRWLGTGGGHLGSFCIAMRQAFADAARQAPCVLAIDEIDGLPARGRDDQTFWDAAVSALLEAMDGLDSAPGVIVIALANNADTLDPALRRSGRLDHHITVERPTVPELAKMFRLCLRPDLQSEDFLGFAARVGGATVADVDRLCKDARRLARHAGRPISHGDLAAVVDREAPQQSEANRDRTAVHEAGHALAAHLEGMRIHRVTLSSPRFADDTLGSVQAAFSHWRGTLNQVLALVRMLLAGRAAEALVLGSPAMGAATDLRTATSLLCQAYASEGMGTTLRWRPSARMRDFEMSPPLAAEVEKTLEQSDRVVTHQLTEHRNALLRLRDALLAKDYLDADAVAEILSGVSSADLPPIGEGDR